jgi:hypothetical protein
LVFNRMMIWFIVFFIVSQIMIEKNWLPKKILELRLLPLCLASIGIILLAAIIGIIIGQPVFVVGTMTILCGSLISWRYRTFGAGVSEKK